MEAPLPTVHMNEEMSAAVKLVAQKIPAVLVTDDHKAIGIVTRLDLIDYMSQ